MTICYFNMYILKEEYMRKLLSTVIAGLFVVTPAFAEQAASGPTVGGKVKIDITQDANDDWGSKTTLGAGINMDGLAFGGFNVESVDGSTFTLDEWQLGTTLDAATVSLGKQGDIWVGAEGEHTIANQKMDESVIVDMGDIAVALEFGDWKNDLTDIEAVQGSYTIGESLTVAGDYDFDSENIVLGSRYDTGNVGGVLTYDVDGEKFAYELDGTASGLTAYLNGDQDDALQNIGANYTWDFNGLEVEPGANYNIDSEELTPKVTVGFSF